MKKHHFLLWVLLPVFIACNQKKKNADPSGSTAAPPLSRVDSVKPAPSAKQLTSILDSTVVRMSRVELTNHPVKDFALLMRVHHDGIQKFIDQGYKQINDRELKSIVKQVEQDLREEVVMLNRFIVDTRFQKQQKESPVSNKLMESMSTVKQTFPASGNNEKDFAVLLIQFLQTANDMVEIMEEEGADYDISGFASKMIPANNEHIEKLRGWVSPGTM